jgi:hypothetical protein
MNRLSTEYERICFKMIQYFQFGVSRDEYRKNIYSFSYPSFGDMTITGKKILIYNRWNEANWGPLFTARDTVCPGIMERARYFSNPVVQEEATKPIQRYFDFTKTKRPFFYDVVKGIVQGILEDDDNDSWADKIIFSNLIKIGKETAPDLYEYPAQNDYAKLLFLLELKEIKPDVVLLITSLDFGEDFSSALGLETLDSIKKSDFVIVKGEYKGAKVILTRCPDVGDADECVMQVLDHLSSPITSKFS